MMDLILKAQPKDKYEKFIFFLQLVVARCKEGASADRALPLLSHKETQEFCIVANKLGVPVWYICEGDYACYKTMNELTREEERR